MKLYFIFFFSLAAGLLHAQNFEGAVVYSNVFKSRIPGIGDEQLGTIVGTRQEYFVKGGNYKSVLNGQSIVLQLYDGSLNRLYNKTAASDTLYWFDASVNADTVISYTVKKAAAVVLGNSCDAIVMKTQSGSTTIYYSAKYKLDPSLYRNHRYSNWAFYTGKAGAVPLKIIVEAKEFRMESTAVEIKKLALPPETFQPDPAAPLKRGL